jgi:hypothetical protein
LPADVPAAEGGRRAADGRENIRTLAAHPVHASALLVGTDTGVWASIGTDAEGGRRWTRHNHGDHGMPNVPVFDIKISRKGQVVAFTYGRGAFVWEEACDGRPSAVVGTNFLPCSRGVRSGRNVSLERGGREIPSDQRLASP